MPGRKRSGSNAASRPNTHTPARNAGWQPMPAGTSPPRWPTLTMPRACSTSWGSSWPNWPSTRSRCCSRRGWPLMPCARSTRRWRRSSGIAARRCGGPNCCTPRPWPPPRTVTSASRKIAAPRPCGCSAVSSARGGPRGPSWSCCCAGSRRIRAVRPRCCRAARRVTVRLDELDPARAVDAHLLTGRLAMAAPAGRGRPAPALGRQRPAPWPAAHPKRRLAGPGHLVRGGKTVAGHAGRL